MALHRRGNSGGISSAKKPSSRDSVGLECGKDVSGVAFAGQPVAGRPAMGDAGTWPPQDLMVVCHLSLGWKADRRWFLNVAQL